MRVYASVCWILTAITSDTKRLFSEGFAPFHVVMASLRRPRGPLLCAALSHDSCNIYMFTLTISICCFWNNQQQRPGEKRGELLQSRTQLGFHDWEAGPDYARLGRERGKEGRGFHFLSLQGPLKVPDGGLEETEGLWACVRAHRPEGSGFTGLRSVTAGPVTPLTSALAGDKALMDFRYVTKSIAWFNCGQKHFNVANCDINWCVYAASKFQHQFQNVVKVGVCLQIFLSNFPI